MRKTKRLLAMTLATIALCGTVGFVGCGEQTNSSGEDRVDETKTQLRVNNYRGGYGDEWLNQLIDRFEAAYADYQGVDGKVGVEVRVNNQKSKGQDIVATISGSNDDIYFSENMPYYDLIGYGSALDISDVVQDTNKDGKTIESKLYDSAKDFLSVDGAYYALPHYEMIGGIQYNITIFEENNLYFAENANNGNDGFIISASDKKSKGPDNQPNTYDDGLPATYDDFFKLCDRMVEKGIIPFIWSGQFVSGYMNYLMNAALVDYEGAEQFALRANFDSDIEAKYIVDSINDDGTVTFKQPFKINKTNGYETFASAGTYYALKFLEGITSKTAYYDERGTYDTHSHTDAQIDFLFSNYESGVKPVAMLIEGGYWENEARDMGAYDRLDSFYGVSERDVNIGYMPMPKATSDKVGEKTTMVDNGSCLAFINSNIAKEKIEIAKEFLRFAYTDDSLQQFSAITNTMISVKYEIDQTHYEQMSNYGKNYVTVCRNAEKVYFGSANPLYISNVNYFNSWFTNSEAERPYDKIKSRAMTAKSYFDGIKSFHSKSNWDSKFSKFYD